MLIFLFFQPLIFTLNTLTLNTVLLVYFFRPFLDPFSTTFLISIVYYLTNILYIMQSDQIHFYDISNLYLLTTNKIVFCYFR